MIVTTSVTETRIQLAAERSRNRPVAFVPTMGALHEGHLSLMKIARERVTEEGLVVASIFVNPTQFAPHEDFDAYPRPMDRDLELCRDLGVDLAFTPERDSMYLNGASIAVTEDRLSRYLCGASRPHFFGGVCTVVAKLFNIVQPEFAVFGEKDFQQLAIIRRMVRDLDFPIEIIGGPIVREEDGLAMSSRNRYLTPEQREEALVLRQSLKLGEKAIQDGERDASRIRELVQTHIREALQTRIDYVEVADPDTLDPLESIDSQVLIAVAVYFGDTRLIDNICLRSIA